MAVNLSKNGRELMAAYKEVVDGKSATNWALFTYEGNSNDIRLAEKGDGGLEQMVEELSSGKVMYAFCRVQDPNSGLPKYVLINWTGEGVKDSRKGLYANHVSSMANFLKGAHVTVNARGEDDVEPDTILEKVAKASGATFNFHKQTQEYRDAPRGPVGSVYRKTNAVEEIQQTKKDDFWVQTQRDEEVRRREENKRAEEERQKLERERREMDERQAKERERKAKERAQQIEQEKIYQKQREEEDRDREQQRMSQQENETKKTGINFAASVQKANEAKSLISQRSFNPRDVFKQREQSFEASDRSSPAASRPGKLQSPFLSQKSSERESPEQPHYAPAPAAVPASSMNPLSPVSPVSPVLSYSPVAAVSPAPPKTDQRAGSPVPAAVYTEEEEWSDEFDDDADEAPPERTPAQVDLYEATQPAGTEEDLYENFYEHTSTTEDHNMEPSGQNIQAKALYDYQAVDDTEITFDPDDIITGIEMLDEGWWRGYGPDGRYGMFPANYVELL
ncbi:drebrin-like protein B [Dicentrarchus labrax]|uniref:Drebrin-like protein n=1 Tax=Dicentrarchus labrax TaxID=13489 RepID=A0A8P4G2Z6_DICLA|nr:drebrin-like protein B [Dicentrarchus labrax]XP_051234489.1 drebrin-like protein B [Dicentrarchus labrax]XP_051234490.1 drebrin-like protein B [Dicentrarchus labrax]